MPKLAFIFSGIMARVFNIAIILFLLTACSTISPVGVSDKSASAGKRPKIHVVIPGDTLFSIAWRYGIKYEILAKHNGIRPPYIIRPSQVIRLDLAGYPAMSAIGGKPGRPMAANAVTRKHGASNGNKHQARKEKETPSLLSHIQKKQALAPPQWRWPAKGPVLSSFQSNSGLNKGIDLGGKLGEPVLAAASGEVVYSGSGLRGYGKLLIVKHNETFLSAYAHNNSLRVKEGEFVKAGQIIADMGSSGTDRIKLHFEIRRDGTPVDPLKFLPRR